MKISRLPIPSTPASRSVPLLVLVLTLISNQAWAQRSSTFGSPQTLASSPAVVTRIVDLDDSHVIGIYKTTFGGSADLFARVGEVDRVNKTITWGTVQTIESANNLSIGVVGISSTTAVIYYELTDDDTGVARVITIDPSTESITNIGDANIYGDGIDRANTHIEQQAKKLTNSTFAIAYVDNDNSDRGTVKIGTIDGTTITFGAANIFSTNTDVNNPSMTALSSTHIAVSWEDDPNGDVGKVRVGEVDGNTVTFGTELPFTTTAVGYTAIAAISEIQFVVAFEDDASTSPADPGSAYVGTVSGTTITLSSSEFQFETSQDVRDLTIDRIQGNEFVIGWNSGATGNTRYIVGEVSGTGASATISYDSQKTVLTGMEGDDSWVSRVGKNTIVFGLTDDEGSADSEVIVATLTPEFPEPRIATHGDLDTFEDALTASTRSVRLSDSKVLITWLDATGSTSNNLKGVVGTISGSDITYGDVKTINSNIFIHQHGLVALSEFKAVIVYEANLDTDEAKYSVLEIDGTDITVSNTATLADAPQFAATRSIDAVALDNSTIVVCYEKDDPDTFTIVAGTVSGSTITWGTPESPNSDDAFYADLERLSATKFALAYEDERAGAANGNEAMILIGTVSGNELTLGTPESFGSSLPVGVTRVAALSETELILVNEFDDTNDFGTVQYVTVSGTDVVFPGGTAPTFYLADGLDDMSIDALSATEFLIAVDGGASDRFSYYTGIVSSNNITLSDVTDVFRGQADDITVSALTSDQVVLAFTNDQNALGAATADRGDALVLDLEATTNPEINVQGNSTDIAVGDDDPSTADHTDFGTGATLSRTFTIQNNGSGTLTLGSNAVTITGTNSSEFTVTSQPSTSVSGSGTATFTVEFSSAVASTRTAQVHINSDDIHEPDYFFDVEAIGVASAPTSATVAATVFLEGAFNGTDLNTTLNSSIPLTQPYTNNGHSGGTAGSIPANAVDWVLVELREAGSAAAALNATKVGSTAGFLMNDGTIKATDGTSDLTVSLSGNSSDEFFVVIYHRNHLPIMSASAISESSGTYTIDFTSSSANTHQTTTALASLSGGKFGMPSGDADGDGDVDGTDLTTWRSQNGSGFTYNTTNADFNLDGVINAIDRNLFWKGNNTASKTSQVPTT